VSRHKLLLVHHFPLTSVTGVTVLIAEMLKLVPELDPSIDIFYLHYEEIAGPNEIGTKLNATYSDVTCIVAMNLQIEVQWDISLALARWCAEHSVPLYNNVQDYWPQHREAMACLTRDWGVLLAGASPFLNASLAKDDFTASFLPIGAQLPPTASWGPKTPPKVVASSGRLVRRKRFSDIVRAFCSVDLDKVAELHLTLLQSRVFDADVDDEQWRLVEAEMARPGVNQQAIRVIRTATVPPDYSPFSVYVRASDYEGFSLTPYEAAYSGCPPIVSDIPPHRAMAEALFGELAEDFLYPVGDSDALASCLVDEIATGRRRSYIRAHRTKLRSLIEERYSVRTTARALVELCRAMETGHDTRPRRYAAGLE
jgi:glycosyltransferase involved in cell wall biosynthesis